MAISQHLALWTPANTHITVATVDSYMTFQSSVGPNVAGSLIANIPGATSYYDVAVNDWSISAVDLGNGTAQDANKMTAFIGKNVGGGEGTFNTFANGVSQGSTGTFQQLVGWDESVNTGDQVVWAIYMPQVDSQPIAGVGKIQAFSTVVSANSSVVANDPDDATALGALTDLLAKFSDIYAGTFRGPLFTGNATQDLFGPQGAIAMGVPISYSNINGTWLVKPV